MRVNNPDIKTFIVHPGTGTIIDADEACVINMDGAVPYDEYEIVGAANDCGYDLYHMYVVMVGYIFGGFVAVGPFICVDEAIAWAEEFADADWYTCRITMPWGEEKREAK